MHSIIKKACLFITFVFIVTTIAYSQSHNHGFDVSCGEVYEDIDVYTMNGQESLDWMGKGGRLVPSTDTLYMLVVFTRFEDDNGILEGWPEIPNVNDPTDVPEWMERIIDDNTDNITNDYTNITNFFYQHSQGQYVVLGDVVYVQAPFKYVDYRDSMGLGPYGSLGRANEDVIKYLYENTDLDFKKYDNWTSNSFTHEKKPIM